MVRVVRIVWIYFLKVYRTPLLKNIRHMSYYGILTPVILRQGQRPLVRRPQQIRSIYKFTESCEEAVTG